MSGAVRPAAAAWSADLGSPPTHVLIAEDDPSITALLAGALRAEGFEVTAVGDGRSARRVLEQRPVQVLLTDFRLPDVDGIALLEGAVKDDPRLVGLIMTGFGTVDLAVKAMKSGAADILVKPFEPEQAVLLVKRTQELERLRRENGVLKQAVLKSGGVRLQGFQLEELEAAPSSPPHGLIESSRNEAAAYERGLAEGERRAAERQSRLERQQAVLAAVIREFERARTDVVERAADQVVELAMAFAGKILREAVERKPELIVAQVREALSRVADAAAVVVRVHPDDVALLEQMRPHLLEVFERTVSVRIEGEASIARGGCRLETPTRFVDATLDSQVQRLGEAMKGRLHEAG
ncbi:FliH/SctL family protein [Candidatus Nitrospira bockiana]